MTDSNDAPFAEIISAAGASTRGGVAILIAVTLAMLIGFSALGTEMVFVLSKQRQMEVAATSAALAGATALTAGASQTEAYTEAYGVAATNGFTTGSLSVTVTPTSPPQSGLFSTIAGYFEVVIVQPQTLPLSALFHSGAWNVTARATAKEGSSASDCVLELDTSSGGTITLDNGVTVSMPACGMAVNSTAAVPLSVYGGATLNAKSVTVDGTPSVYGGGSINPASGVQTGQPAVANPYAGVAVPSYGTCQYNNLAVLGYQNPTLSPGVYCGGISMGSTGTVTMNPGVYIINQGSFSAQGGVTLRGTGVTVVLTGSGSTYATVSIANGATVTLSAPTTGATKGLVFFADPNSPTTETDSFQGGASMNLTGALYFPTQTVSYGNGSSTAATCTQLVAWRMTFTGGAVFDSNCATAGVSTIGGGASQVVE